MAKDFRSSAARALKELNKTKIKKTLIMMNLIGALLPKHDQVEPEPREEDLIRKKLHSLRGQLSSPNDFGPDLLVHSIELSCLHGLCHSLLVLSSLLFSRVDFLDRGHLCHVGVFADQRVCY